VIGTTGGLARVKRTGRTRRKVTRTINMTMWTFPSSESETMIEKLLRRFVKHKEIGWIEIGEKFTRYALLSTPLLSVFVHQLNAPNWHPQCHDHPWGFLAILLRRGYLERIGQKEYRRRPGAILYRPAKFTHNVITPYGTSWSLIVTGPRSHTWGFKPCDRLA
jgi:hypothetical protein